MLVNKERLHTGMRCVVSPEQGVAVTRNRECTSPVLHTLPSGTLVVCAQVQTDEDGETRIRISSPAGWMNARDLEPAAELPAHGLDYDTFRQRHTTVAVGDYYGLDFPFSIAMFDAFGAPFLTDAFRAAGTITPDNAVTQIVELKSLGKFGASENAFLEVRYARSEPGLSEKLFVKFPPPAEREEYKFGLSRMAHGEIAMHKFSREQALPVPVAGYYFGEYSSHTTNYILITDRIPFGIDPIEPAHLKGWDHLIPALEDHYAVLARSLAALAADHRTGALGYGVEALFPYARSARDFATGADVEERVDRLIDFVSRVAPQLFVDHVRDPQFLARWREDLLFGLANKDAVIAYLHSDPDYVGLCHPNLNPDNAWFWREADGKLHAGLLDWGGAGQMSFAQALSGMLMMVDPERHLAIKNMVLNAFIDEFAARGAGKLDFDELHLQYKASLYSTALGMIVGMIIDLMPQFSEADYATMENRFDKRLMESGLYAAVVWIDDMIRETGDTLTPGAASRTIVERVNALGLNR